MALFQHLLTHTNRGLMLLIYFNFNRTSQPFLTDLIFPAVSSLSTNYGRVTSPYLTTVVKFNACNLDTLPQPAAHQCSKAHSGEHFDREFSSSQDTKLQYTY
jgi:hypothetical protein